MLSKHPDVQEALIRELSTLPVDFNDQDLRQLKLLNGVINETLRLHGPVGQGLPRLIPPGGSTFCGYYIPEGVVVGVQAYTMQRNSEVWKQPDAWDPSRWDDPSADQMASFLPFGGGSHGMNMLDRRRHYTS